MNKERTEAEQVDDFLSTATDFQRRYMEGKIQTSNRIASIMKEVGLPAKELAEKWGFTEEEFLTLLNGTHAFDLITISKLEARYAEFLGSKKGHSEIWGFPPYKHS